MHVCVYCYVVESLILLFDPRYLTVAYSHFLGSIVTYRLAFPNLLCVHLCV